MTLTVDDGRKDRLVFDPEAIHIFRRRHLHLRFALHSPLLDGYAPNIYAGTGGRRLDGRAPVRTPVPYSPGSVRRTTRQIGARRFNLSAD
jgi:hypothetical protein